MQKTILGRAGRFCPSGCTSELYPPVGLGLAGLLGFDLCPVVPDAEGEKCVQNKGKYALSGSEDSRIAPTWH